MSPKESHIISLILLLVGLTAFLGSFFLPVIRGFLFPDNILHGWEVALFTLGGILHLLDGNMEVLLAGMFICNLVLISGFGIFFLKRNVSSWFIGALTVSLLYILTVTLVNGNPASLGIGYFVYISSYLLVGGAVLLRKKYTDTLSASPIKTGNPD